MARAMGSAAANRAREMFSPEKVMNAHEQLFAELNEIRRCAPDDAHLAKHGQSPDRSCESVCRICFSSFIINDASCCIP